MASKAVAKQNEAAVYALWHDGLKEQMLRADAVKAVIAMSMHPTGLHLVVSNNSRMITEK